MLGGDKSMNEINPILHIIQPGDTLYNLAMQYGTTVQDIMDNNIALNPYNLRVGQQIFIYPNYEQDSNYWISIHQVKLLEQMNLVWEQHIMWTRMLLISIAENLKDLDATQERLLRNPKDIAEIFRKYYGNAVANRVQQLLTEHLVIGKDLIVALKNKDQEQAEIVNTLALEITSKGYIKVKENYQTSKEKFFAGGDIIGGKQTVAWAARGGREAGKAIHSYLSEKREG